MQVKHLFFGQLLPISNRSKSGYLLTVYLAFLLLLTIRNVNAQDFAWAKAMGGSKDDQGIGVAVDGSGNVFVTGSFSSDTTDFNTGGSGGLMATKGGNDVFLAKYDAAGNLLWAKGMGGKGSDEGYNVAIDTGGGNVYVTGRFNSDTADFNPGGSGGVLTSAGNYDVFLAKYDGDGNFLWAKSMGGNNWDDGWGIAVDKGGNVYISGWYQSAFADFNPGGSGGGINSAGSTDVFLAKYDGNGNFLWVKSMGGSGNDYGWGIAIDGSSNIYITGYFNSAPADFNPGGSGGMLATKGAYDIFLAKYDAGGNYLWSKGIGGMDSEGGMGVAVDGNDNIYVTGYFGSWIYYSFLRRGLDTVDFNPGGSGGILISKGNSDVFLAKYDGGGNFLWAKGLGGSEDESAYNVAVDKSDNVYIMGYFGSNLGSPVTADFNPGGSGGILNSAGDFEVFLAKYNASGNYLWAKGMGGSDNDYGCGVAVDGSGNVYGTGYFKSVTADFNPGGSGGTLTSAGGDDAFVVKFGCSDTFSYYFAISLSCGESYILNDSVYTTTGIYTQAFPNISGCDSTIMLDLTIVPIDKPVITIDTFVLGVTGIYATYQWLLNGEPIADANDSTYTVTENGNYQVVVANEYGCSDTADVYPVNNVNIRNVHETGNKIRIYPNPSRDLIYVNSPVTLNLLLTTLDGRSIKKTMNALHISVKDLPEGMYFLRILDEENNLVKVEKIVVGN